MDDVLLSSKDMDWETPRGVFNELDKEFNFDIDVCATKKTTKCPRFYSPEDDGLAQEWVGTCWMNPPYGREIKHWIRKAYESSLNWATVVCLIPSRTDTEYWHKYVMKGEVRFIRGRLYFKRGGEGGRAPFPSAIAIFKGQK